MANRHETCPRVDKRGSEMYTTKQSNVTDLAVLDLFWQWYEVSYLPVAVDGGRVAA